MFSKPLFKQSWKANGILWLITTIVSAFVLTVIMLLVGSKGIGKVMTSLDKTIIQQTLSSNFENSSLNYYSIASESLEAFDYAFLDYYVAELKENPMPNETMFAKVYEEALNHYLSTVDKKILEVNQDFKKETPEYEELKRAALAILNPNNLFNEMYETFESGSTPPEYDIYTLIASIDPQDIQEIYLTGKAPEDLYDVANNYERITYRNNRAFTLSSIILAGTMSSEEAISAILDNLKDTNINREIYNEFGFDYQGIKKLANQAIVTYQARYDYEIASLDPADNDYEKRLIDLKAKLKKSITATVLSNLPEELDILLKEMDEKDMYANTLDLIYFKIVGMLIAIIYIIMASVNLISGQVESGALAYVLATGTKRNTITFTQIIFLISSTFLMFLTTTIVSIICFNIATPNITKINNTNLILIGLITFIVAFAFCGINFLTSAIFNRSRIAMGIGGGISIITLIFTIIGLFGSDKLPSMIRMEDLNIFNYFSIITLFDSNSILEGTSTYLWKGAILIAIGLAGFIIGSIVFKKKDLPL